MVSTYKIPVLNNFAWQPPVIDMTHDSPPAASKGDRYVVATGAGAWSGQDNNIAEYNGSTWDIITAIDGMAVYNKDDSKYYKFGLAWGEMISGGGGTPGGDSGDLQYNNAGAFGGFGKYDATNKFMGVNQETPLATGHFGADTYTIGNPSALSITAYTALTSGGVPFGSAYTYNVYGKRTEKTVDFFSATPDSVASTSYSITPTAGGTPNYAGGGYSGDSTQWNFTVYPLYDTDTKLGGGYPYSVIGDGTGYSYYIDHTITAPNWGTPSGYIVVRDNDNAYYVTATLTFIDSNDIWTMDATTQLATYTQITGLQIDLSWTGATNAEDYRIHNTTTNKWTDKGSTGTTISDTGAWTAGTPTVIPTYFTDTGLISDGQAIFKEELTHQGTKVGFFNTTPIYKPTGDVATALGNLGLITSPTYDTGSLGGTAYRIPFINSAGVGSSDGDFIYKDDAVGFGFAKTNTNVTGINADSFNIASQINFKMATFNTAAGTKNNVSVANRTHLYSNAAGVSTFTGFAGGYDGKIIYISNGPSGTMEFVHNSSSSSVGNRIQLGVNQATFTMTGLGPRTYGFIYDATNGYWKLLGGDREVALTSNNNWSGTNSFNGFTIFTKGVSTVIVSKTANYTTTIDDFILNCSGTFTVTLMASGPSGYLHWIKNNGTGVITINTTSSETIDGIASGVIKLNQYDSILVQSINTGNGWKILNFYRAYDSDNLTTVVNTYTVVNSDSTVVCNKSTAFTVTLPTAQVGKKFTFKNIGAGTVTLDGAGSDTIDGATTQTLVTWATMTIQCYAANSWAII